jgi:AcrR family transcriptional regulator
MPRPRQDPTEAKVRAQLLATASSLFYRCGVRAVGVDLIVAKAGVAKTSLYRHFGTKDELIAAFLRREDADFWASWEQAAAQHPDDAAAELDAQLEWIGRRVERPHYRGCPQLNVAAEFPDQDHPARRVATAHKRELRRRLEGLARRLGAADPGQLGGALSLLVNGAFVGGPVFQAGEATPLLRAAAHALVAAGTGARTGGV